MSETNCANEIAGVALEIQQNDKNTVKFQTNISNAGKENQMCDQMENKQQLNCERTEKSKSCGIMDKSVIASNVSKMEKQTMEEMRPQRICLVGTVIENEAIVLAAEQFNVPVVTSVSGAEFIGDTEWITYFVMQEFEGNEYERIRKTQHRIYGPPALQQMARKEKELKYLKKPTYNFAMEGIITCFTGIRKKDELTLLVDLIHKMGGSIRKDLTFKSTHLICSASSGEKYRYAMTFRLTVVRPEWVHAAWKERDNLDFCATQDEFTQNHRLRRFEGQRVCFFGFTPEEHQEMVDILKSNGGIPVDLDDPACSHVILANNVDHFPEQLSGPPTSPPPLTAITQNVMNASTAATPSIHIVNTDKCLPPDGLDKLNLNDKVKPSGSSTGSTSSQVIVDTPKKFMNCDGIVLPGNEENQFLEPTNLSPILHNIEEEEENADDANDKEMSKRKRDSFDNISIISTDTFAAQFNSAKKPKLIRTGSITRSLRRSMSFVALKNPMNMIRTRRNSIDPNASINSITSMNESTFSESIKRPVKEKLQSLKDRLTHGNRSKREFCLTPKTSKKFNTQTMPTIENDDNHFVPPNEISMLSCRKILNSTMNTTDAIEAAESDEQSQLAVNGPIASSKVNNVMDNNQDVADSTVNCTTVMSTNHIIPPLAERKPDSRTHIVKSDWFWFTIQDGYANEEEHLFCDYLDSIANTPGGDRRDSLPPGVKQRKRKRFSNAFSIGASGKRRSSISDAGLSVSGSFLDCTGSPNINRDLNEIERSVDGTPKAKAQKSMRYNHFMDLFGTESNYVGILHTIVSLFQKPLEDMADTNDALLNKSEVRAIFNNFSPIHEVHSQMLNHFRELQSNWSEKCTIGKIILDHREALIKAYPPYVNFFEQMKETLQQCDVQNPRFHAFLKINQAKPECGRQTLEDLMIRPVQRLPSMSLLINDILKHTPPTNPDHKELEQALKAIKEVMTYINEDKRKTEGRLALFDIFNDIDNCPPDLVSSHRSFISKCEVTELTNCLSGRDDPLMLFLFTDYIEICKIRKSRGFNNMKSPTGTMHSLNTTTRQHNNTHNKTYKHIRLVALSTIPYVYDITDSSRAFAITIKDKLYCFNIADDADKIIYLKNFCKQLAENACRADYEQFLRSYESHDLGIDISDINFGTLKKVYNYARTRLKVSRAFSFKNTPLKLKRAVSTTSPLYASTNSLM